MTLLKLLSKYLIQGVFFLLPFFVHAKNGLFKHEIEPSGVSSNTLPTVKITSPVSGFSFEVGETIDFEVEAKDQDGEIVKVEYYSSNLLIGTSETALFSFSWADATAGIKEITAHAFDNDNGKTVSEKVTIIVALNVPPTVNITSPSEEEVFQEGTNVEIQVTASDSDGTISKVEFYANDSLIGETSTLPYTLGWDNPIPDNYILKAKAVDNKNAASFSKEIPIRINKAPQINFHNPSNRQVFAADTIISLSATASDTDGTVSKVEFYANDSLIGEASALPYTFNWNSPIPDNYILKAKAIDNDNGVSYSKEIEIKVNKAPQVHIANPTNGEVFVSGTSISLLATASDIDGTISKVAFFINGNKIGESDITPFTINWHKPEAGVYEFSALATDENGESTMSEKVKVFIQDANAVAAKLVSLTADTIVAPQAVVPLLARPSNGFEVSKIEFYVNGKLTGEAIESPFEMDLQVGDEGSYEVLVKAYYQDSGIFESDMVTITVNKVLSTGEGFREEVGILLYPNPAINQVGISFDLMQVQQVNLILTDIAGNNLYQQLDTQGKVGKNIYYLPLDNLPKGMYFLYVDINEKRHTQKLLKQ